MELSLVDVDSLVEDYEEIEDPRLKPPPLFKWQRKPWLSRSLVLLLTGSVGGGKSHFALQKIVFYLLKYPNTFGLIIRKTRQSLTSSAILYLETNIIPAWEEMGYKGSKHEKTNSRFIFPNGSILAYAGLGTREERTRLRSIGKSGGVSIILVEEASEITREDFNELMARLRDGQAPWLQMILATNPDFAQHWINLDLIQGNQAKVYYSSFNDNPTLPDTYKTKVLENLSGVMYQRLVKGQWVSAEGIILDQYDPSRNLVDGFEIPEDWRRVVSIDFGVENPTVVHWYGIDPKDNVAYLYREFYKTFADLADEVAPLMLKYAKEEKIEAYIADHDAAERRILAKHGIPTIKARKDVLYGIRVVNNRFKSGKLKIMRNALIAEDPEIKAGPKCFVDEIGAYVWSKPSSQGTDRKDVPVKKYDHGCDDCRYAMAYLERGISNF